MARKHFRKRVSKGLYLFKSEKYLRDLQIRLQKDVLTIIYWEAAKSQELSYFEACEFFGDCTERFEKDMKKFIPLIYGVFAKCSLEIITADEHEFE